MSDVNVIPSNLVAIRKRQFEQLQDEWFSARWAQQNAEQSLEVAREHTRIATERKLQADGSWRRREKRSIDRVVPVPNALMRRSFAISVKVSDKCVLLPYLLGRAPSRSRLILFSRQCRLFCRGYLPSRQLRPILPLLVSRRQRPRLWQKKAAIPVSALLSF